MKIAKEGLPFIAVFLVPGILFLVLHLYLPAIVFGIFLLFSLYFFRDPERSVIRDDRVLLSPADGKIMDISLKEDLLAPGRMFRKVSIFLNIFNVHITRSPMEGKILRVVYQPGKFLPAQRAEASERNEQNAVLLSNEKDTIIFRLIAGLIARRIVFKKKEDDLLQQGERVGMIRFGSRVDLFFDRDMDILVKTGDKVKGGISPIARKKNRQKENKKS